MICIVLCVYREMVDEQPRYRHGWLSQYTSVIERAKSLWVSGESFRVSEELSPSGHVSLVHDETHVAHVHALDIVVYAHDPRHTVRPGAATKWFSRRSRKHVTTSSLCAPSY